MPPIRNSSVARGSGAANANTVAYTVPASTVLLLKDVHIFGSALTTTDTWAILLVAPGIAEIAVLIGTHPTAAQYASWQGWIALNAGDQLVVSATQAYDYWISGALLPSITGF